MASDVCVDNAVKTAEEAVVLYDLTVQADWRLEPEPAVRVGKEKPSKDGWTVLKSVGLAVSPSGANSLPTDLIRLLGLQISWKLQLSRDGELLAILQDNLVEIRSSQNEFTSVTTRWMLPGRDPNPQLRQLCWSFDNSMLAISDSSGKVDLYDARLGMAAAQLQASSTPKRGGVGSDLSQAVSGMVIKELPKNLSSNKEAVSDSQHWFAELLIVTFQGNLASYLISREGDVNLRHTFSFSRQCPSGVFSLVYDARHSLLVVGSCAESVSPGKSVVGDTVAAAQDGITLWRILSDVPYYKLVTDCEMDAKLVTMANPLVKRLRNTWFSWSKEALDGVYKLSLSPDGQLLASVHHSGRLSTWHFPSLRLKHTWPLESQPDHKVVNSEWLGNPKRRKALKDHLTAYNITDIGWWSNEALVLVRGTGSVTVSSVHTLQNLLGTSPEWFEPTPSVTWACVGSFISIECESKTVSSKRQLVNDTDNSYAAESGSGDDFFDSDDELDMTLTAKASNYIKQGLYFVTDIERFQPPRKRPKLVSKTYRLVCLKSTTPDELYSRKIDNEEYGEALQLAKTYHLDCDLVYQRQWRKSPVSVASIQDYLSKIVKRSWVLHECVERVPEDFDAMNELLKYGLRGTDVEALLAIGKKQDKGRFILCDSDEVYVSLDVDNDDDSTVEMAEELQRRKAELLKEVDFSNLTLEQQELCRVRRKLLQFSDRLHTYEAILGGMHIACEKYDHRFFDKFRSQNVVQLAVDYAHSADPDALNYILIYHSAETLKHRLAILSNFPETFLPSCYSDLLPEITTDEAGQYCVAAIQSDAWRQLDWCERPDCRVSANLAQQDFGAFLYEEKPAYSKFCGEQLSSELITQWYCERACEIEQLSGQVDGAMELIKLGIERQVQGLETLYDDLKTMEMLVYECGVDATLSFQQLREMSNIDRLRLMMQRSSQEAYLKNIRNWVLPFLRNCEKYRPGSFYSLLKEYLVTMANKDLTLCLLIFKASKANVSNRIIPDDKRLMSIALDCIYALTVNNQLTNAWDVLECLPQKGFGQMDEESVQLHRRVDDLERHLEGAYILEKNGHPQTIAFFRDTEASIEEATKLFVKITRTAARKKPALVESQLKTVLTDMWKLRESVYQCVSKEACCEVFIESLLCSGSIKNIALAGRMLDFGAGSSTIQSDVTSTTKEKHQTSDRETEADPVLNQMKVPHSSAVKLVISAAREYFDASATMDDPDMDLARACLNLIPNDESGQVDQEKDLIESLGLLVGFGVKMLPVQVRMCDNRLNLVQKAIDARSSTYKNYQRLLKLGRFLRVGGNSSKEMHGQVMRLVAQAALKVNDYKTAHEACTQLVEANYAPVWTECKTLAETVNFHDVSAKIDLLSFAIIHCHPEMLADIIHAKALLQMQVYYEHIHTQCGNRDSPSFPDGLPLTAHGAVEKTREVLSSTNRATRLVLSRVSDATWWKKTIGNLRPVKQDLVEVKHDDQNVGFARLGCHPFYEQIDKSLYCNQADVNYLLVIAKKLDFTGMTLNECVLRASNIEDLMTEGSSFNAGAITEVLLRLAEDVISRDTLLGLAYLLALPNPVDADRCFERLPQTNVVLQLAVYYYALQLVRQLRTGSVLSSRCDDLYQLSVENLISTVNSYLLQQQQLPNCDKLPERTQQITVRFHRYKSRLVEYVQAQALQQLDRGIDVGRFVVDEKYKMETILGLAMSLETDVFNMAVSLANSYKVSLWEVYMTHLEYLFEENSLSTEQMSQRIQELGILPVLVSRDDVGVVSRTESKNPDSRSNFAKRMQLNVLPLISGTDHERLIYYYTLLSECDVASPADGSLTPTVHVRLLKKLKTAAPELDYRKLTDDNIADPLAIIEPVLTRENVMTLAKLASHIPSRQQTGCIQQSSVIRIWCTKMFFQNPSTSKKPVDTAVEWLHRYDLCSDYLPKMSPEDFHEFIRSISFSSNAVDLVSVDSRRTILKSATKYAKQQQSGKKKNPDNAGTHLMTWEEVTHQLQQLLHHLDRLNSRILVDMKASDSEIMRNYAQRFDLSQSDNNQLHLLLIEMILGGCELATVDELRKTTTNNNWTINSLVVDSVELIFSNLRVANDSWLLKDCSPIDAFKSFLEMFMKYNNLSNDELHISLDDVLSVIKRFCSDTTVKPSVRIDVVKMTEQLMKLSADEQTIMLLYRTQAAIADMGLDVQVTSGDVANAELLQELFNKLLLMCDRTDKLITLCHLLLSWPTVVSSDNSVESNPWCRLFQRLVEHGSCEAVVGDLLQISRELHAKSSLSVEGTCYIADCLLKHSPPNSSVAAQFLLLTTYEQCHDMAVDVLHRIAEFQEDGELFELVLKRHLVPRIVSTSLYPLIVDYVLSNQSADSAAETMPYYLQVNTVVNQLIETGYQVEAGSILMQHRATHRALRTFDAAFSILTRFFNR